MQFKCHHWQKLCLNSAGRVNQIPLCALSTFWLGHLSYYCNYFQVDLSSRQWTLGMNEWVSEKMNGWDVFQEEKLLLLVPLIAKKNAFYNLGFLTLSSFSLLFEKWNNWGKQVVSVQLTWNSLFQVHVFILLFCSCQ